MTAKTLPPEAISPESAAELIALAAELEAAPESARDDLARERLPLVSFVLESIVTRAKQTRDPFDVGFSASARSAFQPAGNALRSGFPAAALLARAGRELANLIRRHPDAAFRVPFKTAAPPVMGLGFNLNDFQNV